MTTPERILELLPRNLQEVFGEGDAARRRTAIEDFYTDDCVLHVPEPIAYPGAGVDAAMAPAIRVSAL